MNFDKQILSNPTVDGATSPGPVVLRCRCLRLQSGSSGGILVLPQMDGKEVENITTTLAEGGCQATRLSGSDATERGSSEPSAKRIPPLAFRGHRLLRRFFFPDPCCGQRCAVSGQEMDHEAAFKWSVSTRQIRSGLIPAGGNLCPGSVSLRSVHDKEDRTSSPPRRDQPDEPVQYGARGPSLPVRRAWGMSGAARACTACDGRRIAGARCHW